MFSIRWEVMKMGKLKTWVAGITTSTNQGLMALTMPTYSRLTKLRISTASMAIGLAALTGISTAYAQQASEISVTSRFYVNLDAAGVLFNESGKINVAGNRIPGSIGIEDNPAVTVNLGYFVTPHLAIDLLAGFPPHAAVVGTGKAAPLGTAAYTNYGPAVLSLLYHFDGLGHFHPYIGPGINYTLFMHTHGVNLQNVKIANHLGAAFTVGFNYDVRRRWAFNFAVTKILLSTQVRASDGPYPVEVKAVANPTVVQAGVTYRF